MPFTHWKKILESIYGGGRRYLLAGDVLAPLTGLRQSLKELGAGPIFRVAASRGTGPLPPGDDALGIDLGVRAPPDGGLMGAIRASQRALAALSPEVVARIDTFDPKQSARVIGPIFDDGEPVAGRAKFGRRLPSWQALEDKTLMAPLFRAAGVELAPEQVVAGRAAALLDAHNALAMASDAGLGCVWAADNSEGWHGGAESTLWVPDRAEAHRQAKALDGRFARMRIMPFLDGIPCSIHGVVFPGHVLVLRPCELLVLRRRDRSGLLYARAATFWDPRPDDRATMRTIARRVGERLRETVGYRGAFTIDGVMCAGGFLPTELNPRFGAALGVMSRGIELPLMLTFLAVAEGVVADWRPPALEQALLQAADAKRSGAGGTTPALQIEEAREAALLFRDHLTHGVDAHLVPPSPDGAPSEADADVVLGPGPKGAYLNIALRPDRTPVGRSVAPRICAALACLDAAWALGIGALEPAPDLRPRVLDPGLPTPVGLG